jgi:hypothetical protein
MNQSLPFNDVLDAADKLPPEEQEELISILHRRLAERGRKRIVASVQDARREFSSSGCQPASSDDLIREALS